MRRLIVTGGHGFLGRRLVPRAAAAGWEVVAPTSAELDVRSADALRRLFDEVRPTAVIHLAYRRDEPDTIVEGSVNVARASADASARLVHLSTDLVFAGRDTPYREDDAPAPLDAYGRAKAAAEHEVTTIHPAAAVVRTSLLLADPGDGDPGPVERAVLGALDDPGSFTFFVDEVRCPARASEVAAGLLVLAADEFRRGPIHLGGPEPLSRLELAQRLARRAGADPARLRHATLAEAGATGRRAGRVVLDSRWAASAGFAPGRA